MRYARVITSDLAVRADPGGRIVGYLHEGERVNIIGEPVTRTRTWWPVQQSDPIGVLHGWVAQGDDNVVWLEIEPEEQPAPQPKTQPARTMPKPPSDDPPSPVWPMMVVVGIGILAMCSWIFGSWR